MPSPAKDDESAKLEPRYEVLALFTVAMLGASLLVMSTGTLTPFIESRLHIGAAQLGLLLSAQMVGAVLTTSVAGMLTDRFGDKVVVLWSGLFMGTSLLLAAAIPNFAWLLFWLCMYGIGYAAVTPAGSHAIVFFFKKEDRGFAMGLRQCGVPLAGLLGSIILPAIALRFDYQWALVAAGLVTIAACATASEFYREPKSLRGESVSIRGMLLEMLACSRDVRLILITLTGMVLIVSQMAVMAFLTLTLVHEAAYTIALAVTIFGVSQVAAIAGRLSWGWASDHIFKGSRAIPLMIACIVIASAAFAFSWLTPHTPFVIVALAAAVLGFSAEGWLGVGVIAIAEIGGAEHSGSALGAGLTWIFVAAFVAPTLFGAIADVHGYGFAWRAMAGLQLAGIVPAFLASVAIRRYADAALQA